MLKLIFCSVLLCITFVGTLTVADEVGKPKLRNIILNKKTDITTCGPDVFFDLLKLRGATAISNDFAHQIDVQFPQTRTDRNKYGASFKEMKWLIEKHIGKADVLTSKMENVHFIIDRIDILVSIVTDVSNHFVILTNAPNSDQTYIVDPTIGNYFVENKKLEKMLMRGNQSAQLIFIPILGRQVGQIEGNIKKFNNNFEVSIARGRARPKYTIEFGVGIGSTRSVSDWFYPSYYVVGSSYYQLDRNTALYSRLDLDSITSAEGISWNDLEENTIVTSSLDRLTGRRQSTQRFVRLNFERPINSYYVNGSIQASRIDNHYTDHLMSQNPLIGTSEELTTDETDAQTNINALIGVTKPWIFYQDQIKYTTSISGAISKSLISNSICHMCNYEVLTLKANISASTNDAEYNNWSYGLGTTANFASTGTSIHVSPSLERYYPDNRLLVRLSSMLSTSNKQSGLSLTNSSLSVYRPLSNEETLGASLNVDWDESGSINSKSIRLFRQHANGWNISLEYTLGQEYLSNIKSNRTVHDVEYGFVDGDFADKRHLSLSLSYKWDL